MLYTGIIAALSSLDLGIKWLIEQEKPEELDVYKRQAPYNRRLGLAQAGIFS